MHQVYGERHTELVREHVKNVYKRYKGKNNLSATRWNSHYLRIFNKLKGYLYRVRDLREIIMHGTK